MNRATTIISNNRFLLKLVFLHRPVTLTSRIGAIYFLIFVKRGAIKGREISHGLLICLVQSPRSGNSSPEIYPNINEHLNLELFITLKALVWFFNYDYFSIF